MNYPLFLNAVQRVTNRINTISQPYYSLKTLIDFGLSFSVWQRSQHQPGERGHRQDLAERGSKSSCCRARELSAQPQAVGLVRLLDCDGLLAGTELVLRSAMVLAELTLAELLYAH